MKSLLECLGHQIDAEGFHHVEAKVEAIQDAPPPTNVSELMSFFGMGISMAVVPVVAHKFPDGSKKPIAYVPSTLTKPEQLSVG